MPENYTTFLERKAQIGGNHGFEPDSLPPFLFDFQNPGETVFTPFMGVGSEVYSPIMLGRRGVGAELKSSYYRQAVKNVEMAAAGNRYDQQHDDLFGGAA